jgi:two-component system phosphate regulon response regulator PhoB
MTPQLPCGRNRILVVDDEPSIATYLTTVLEDDGYEVHAVTDAEQALRVAHQHLPDLITLDVMMPRRSGVRLYQELKLDPRLREIPVVFVSAFSRSSSFGPAQFRQMIPDERIPVPDVYFEKPVIVPEFLKAVAAVLAAGRGPGPAREGRP